MKKLILKGDISRRSVLKGMAAVVATASISGCSTNAVKDTQIDILAPREGLTFDTEMRIASSSGPYNCGAKCQHKIHYKNDRIYHLTSAGDIPRAGSYEKDNSEGKIGAPIQRRACVRGTAIFKGYTNQTD